jgi:hypothetical protein
MFNSFKSKNEFAFSFESHSVQPNYTFLSQELELEFVQMLSDLIEPKPPIKAVPTKTVIEFDQASIDRLKQFARTNGAPNSWCFVGNQFVINQGSASKFATHVNKTQTPKRGVNSDKKSRSSAKGKGSSKQDSPGNNSAPSVPYVLGATVKLRTVAYANLNGVAFGVLLEGVHRTLESESGSNWLILSCPVTRPWNDSVKITKWEELDKPSQVLVEGNITELCVYSLQ